MEGVLTSIFDARKIYHCGAETLSLSPEQLFDIKDV
jgi:hypothetical protein